MFKISRKQTIIRASILGSLIIAILSMAAFFIVNNHEESNATTQDGAAVTVDIDWSYGNMSYGDHETHYYNVFTDGTLYDGYCAEPRKGNPEGNHTANRRKNNDLNNRIKLMIYLREHDAGNSIFDPIKDDSFWGSNPTVRKYVFTHAVIGVLYNNNQDYKGLLPNHETQANKVTAATTILASMITGNDAAWQNAQDYILFNTGGGAQDVVWIEPGGILTVQKLDDQTGTPQGDANFNGIIFSVYDGSELVDRQELSAGNTVTFRGLDLDKTYTVVEEIGSNISYILNATPYQSVSISSITKSEYVSFSNTVKHGDLRVKKIDTETGTCTNIGTLSFKDTVFQIFNGSANSIRYNGNDYASGTLIATKTLEEGECGFVMEGLPYGRYTIKELQSAKGYVLDDTERTVTIPGSGEVVYPHSNQPIRGDIKITKRDYKNNLPMANTAFNISALDENNQVMESHIILADENGIADTSADVENGLRLHTFNTNGYDEIFYSSEDPIVYAGYGTWFGKDSNGQALAPNDNLGALPYGTYLIEELTCDANRFCYNIVNEKMTKQITQHNQLLEIDWDNDCAEFSIQTEAKDESDGDHYIEAGQKTRIIDHVSYCAKKNFTFTITGTLMDKETGEPFLVNGQKVEKTAEVTPTQDCDNELKMDFEIDTSDLAGKSLVVFEELYYKDTLKAYHKDITDENQTIYIVKLGTVATDEKDEDHFIVEGEETTIVDKVDYCAKKNTQYRIKGILMNKTTGEPLLINGEKVEQTVDTALTDEACGTAELSFEIDSTDLSGISIVAFETLYELIPGEPDTETKVISHEDLNDDDQTVTVINLTTYAQNSNDNSKVFPLNTDVTVTDKVRYCLKAGLTYTLKGVIMDKSTGEKLLINGAPVEQTLTFTPEENCGEVNMYFDFNTTNLPGAQLVVFESLYYDDDLLIEHHDLDNEDQSFEIDITVPETGYITNKDSGVFSHPAFYLTGIVIIAPISIYFISRYHAKRNLFK